MAITAETAAGVKTASTVVASSDWSFGDCSTMPFPGKPDPSRICMKNGFQPDTMYELRYTVKDPLVLGVGLAATRDINSFFRNEKQDALGTPNPVAGKITWAVSEGSSQSGAFLRLMLLLGFNQDEAGRKVWDGMNPHISARVIDLNRRFALPGGATLIGEVGYEAAAWWEDWNDTAACRARPAFSIDVVRPTHVRKSWKRSALQRCGDCVTRSRLSVRRESGHSTSRERPSLLFRVCPTARGGWGSTCRAPAGLRRLRAVASTLRQWRRCIVRFSRPSSRG